MEPIVQIIIILLRIFLPVATLELGQNGLQCLVTGRGEAIGGGEGAGITKQV